MTKKTKIIFGLGTLAVAAAVPIVIVATKDTSNSSETDWENPTGAKYSLTKDATDSYGDGEQHDYTLHIFKTLTNLDKVNIMNRIEKEDDRWRLISISGVGVQTHVIDKSSAWRGSLGVAWDKNEIVGNFDGRASLGEENHYRTIFRAQYAPELTEDQIGKYGSIGISLI